MTFISLKVLSSLVSTDRGGLDRLLPGTVLTT